MAAEFATHIRREACTNGITNCVFNGVIAWYLVRTKDAIPVWGGHGLLVDFFATGLILLFIVTLIVVPLTRRKLKQGELLPDTLPESAYSRFLLFLGQRHLALASLMLGLVGASLFVPPTAVIFAVLQVDLLSPQVFAATKGVWAGLIAGAMVPVMIRVGVYSYLVQLKPVEN